MTGLVIPGFSTDLSTSAVDKSTAVILQVALDTPLRRAFDYLPPPRQSAGRYARGPGCWVPFGRRRLLGVLVGVSPSSTIPDTSSRPSHEILDEAPVFDPVTFELLRWAADYYHHPIGEVFAAALPASLREGQPVMESRESWRLTAAGRQQLAGPAAGAPRSSSALLAWLAEHGPATADADRPGRCRAAARTGGACLGGRRRGRSAAAGAARAAPE